MPIISSISGLRATLGEMTPQLIADYVSAFCQILPQGEIIVGRDGRPSGRWIEQIVVGTIIALGRSVRLIGIVPTPTVQLEVEHSESVGGIAITASHNPSEWNGLKFLNGDGVFFDSDENNAMWEKLDLKHFVYSKSANDYELNIDLKAIERHVSRVLDVIKNNTQSIFKKSYSVVVDAVNASGSIPVPFLLRKLGCNVTELYCQNDGVFPHMPEPLPINLSKLAEKVKELNADIGIAVDPDADRLVLIDENGIAIGEELTIVLSIMSVLINKPSNQKVVVNYSTTGLVEKVAQKYDAEVFRSAVGEINVVKKMKEVGAIIGGEGSGGVILPKCHYGRDSLVGIALVLDLMTKLNKTLSQICDSLPKVSMIKTKFDLNFEFKTLIPKIEKEFHGYEFQREDGIRIVFNDGWLHIRSSNTEPIMRIISEFETQFKAEEMIERVKKLI